MSTLLQTCLITATGKISHSVTGPIDHYSNGLPFTALGELCVQGGAGTTPAAYWHMGLPFDANGRILMSSAGNMVYGSGAAVYRGVERNVARSTQTLPVVWNAGVPYSADGDLTGANEPPA